VGLVSHPTSINQAFIPYQIKDYGVGIPAELAKKRKRAMKNNLEQK
jgi:hypothetical protein